MLLSRSSKQFRAERAADKAQPAGWFGDFDQGESTYTVEGDDADLANNPANRVQFGWDPSFTYPGFGSKRRSLDKPWFHESLSAGPDDAWQTHYPALETSVAGNRIHHSNAWRDTPEGWVQDYSISALTGPRTNGAGAKQAEWFDSSVLNVDGFGRRPVPLPGTPRSLAMNDYDSNTSFTERTVNTTLACPSVGCTANATLQAFDAATEEAANCRLNIQVHATDFDDDWGRENIDFFTVNGLVVRAICDPMARGCNSSAWRPLYPCLSEYSVDDLVDATGAMTVTGRLSKLVDECPFEGNLLSGVVEVTCMVRPKPPALSPVRIEPEPNAALQRVMMVQDVRSDLQCSAPGCTARAQLNVDPTTISHGGSCFLNVSVVQTDFDGSLGVPEQIDFIYLEGFGNITTDVRPGQNPCQAAFSGSPLNETEKVYQLITNLNITDHARKDPYIRVAGKISAMVDECASRGYLLDALVTVRCMVPMLYKPGELTHLY